MDIEGAQLNDELARKVRDIVEDLPLDGRHRESIEELYYSIAEAASLYHLQRWEIMAVAKAVQELLSALEMFSRYRDIPKVSVFGSARTARDNEEYLLTKRFAELISEEGYYVITGAGPGIMEAANAGAGRDKSFGLNIKLPFEQYSNEIIRGDEKDFSFRYFFTRKLMFVIDASAIIACPGGFGTMDELYEVLTLIQNGKNPIVPVILLNSPRSTFWKDWDEFAVQQYMNKNLISPSDRSLYKIITSAEEARDEITTFYKNFDSYRYWKENYLILRVKKELSNEQIRQLSCQYDSICLDGKIHRVKDQPFFDKKVKRYKDMYYLGLHFNRRDFGGLRQLIDAINRF